MSRFGGGAAAIQVVDAVFRRLLHLLPAFRIIEDKVLPYGMKAHTRSVSWLVEQVITQQTKFKKDEVGVEDVDFDLPDTALHDCVLTVKGKRYWVNVKIHNMAGKETRNDISAVEKLFMQYHANSEYDLIYACFGIHFEGIVIRFDPQYLHLFPPEFLPIYVNPRNDKIQALYHHTPVVRTRPEFLSLLQAGSKSIVLKGKK